MLFRPPSQVYMSQGNHAGIIEACVRYGDMQKGGDPQLWMDVLEYFAAQDSDCTEQVGAVPLGGWGSALLLRGWLWNEYLLEWRCFA